MQGSSARMLALAAIPFFVACLVSSAGTAHAQDSTDDERARLHFSAGRSYYEEGNYEQALVEFQRAYDLSHRDVLLVNIANAQERLGQWREASATLERFVASLPEGDEQRPTLSRRIENLRSRADQHEAELRAREQTQTTTTTTTTSGEPSSSTTEPATTTTTTSGASEGLLVPSLVAFGVGAAGLIAFATLGGLALAEESSVADGCGATMSCTPAEVQAMDDLAIGADVSLAIGLAGVATGAILLIVDPPRGGSSESASARVMPFGHREGAGISVQGSF